jgi:hypothetical protein
LAFLSSRKCRLTAIRRVPAFLQLCAKACNLAPAPSVYTISPYPKGKRAKNCPKKKKGSTTSPTSLRRTVRQDGGMIVLYFIPVFCTFATHGPRRKRGRPKAIDQRTFDMALQLYEDKNNPVGDICKKLGIARRTFYRYVEQHKKDQPEKVSASH